MNRTFIYLLIASLSHVTFTSCSLTEEVPSDISDYDNVITVKNIDFLESFDNSTTFMFQNGVIHLEENDSVSTYNNTTVDTWIMEKTMEEMRAVGYEYTKTKAINGADLSILLYINNQNINAVTAWPTASLWDKVWGEYGYYPYYSYSMVSSFVYDQSAIIVELVDNRIDLIVDNRIEHPVIWQGFLAGATDADTESNQKRIEDGIHLMFKISPYISVK
ncbi:DUF4136 domain-containing protein [Flammeovirga kamogawensis]|uniref:DUF4136 domain-containing protein n=1 Tax=Flammeovirga kamogawensis TaxID=373891 RepID=A0ABX8H2M8_9BACT|nr:DUF4136 domain-containing protein [Flammeovirga kamogawensis]MBB6460269.1 hypothetical protein [Flammeovirga kamogawensis]QWG10080.1 DUF4136 domain-containing protein [Flammeovirga kamogawensis]TRX65587.1 DUF4136 domain-containing protein [Flammeovirga kamogawensis]